MRARIIKPGFFKNEELAEIGPNGMLLFQGLWMLADREGRLEDRPKRIKIEVLPYFDDVDAEALLSALHDRGFINRYEVNGSRFIQIVNWSKHQIPHYRETPSQLPAPEGQQDDRGPAFSEALRQRILERDNYACAECGVKENLAIEHIVPWSKGGSNHDDNLRTLCRACNNAKAAKPATLVQGCVNVGPTLSEPPDQVLSIPDLDLNTTDQDQSRDQEPKIADQTPSLVVNKAITRGESKPKAIAAKPAMATRLPDPWPLTLEREQYAVAQGVDPVRTHQDFCDYWHAKAGPNARKLNWDATWRTWCRRAAERGYGLSRASPYAPLPMAPMSKAEAVLAAAYRQAAMEEAEQQVKLGYDEN